MNDILDLNRDLLDNTENITMKIKKSRKKYDKQEKIEKKRTTRKKYKKQKGGTPMKLGILLITTHGNLNPEEPEETYTNKMTVRKINAVSPGVCNYISPDSLIDMGNSMSTFINSVRKQWEEENIANPNVNDIELEFNNLSELQKQQKIQDVSRTLRTFMPRIDDVLKNAKKDTKLIEKGKPRASEYAPENPDKDNDYLYYEDHIDKSYSLTHWKKNQKYMNKVYTIIPEERKTESENPYDNTMVILGNKEGAKEIPGLIKQYKTRSSYKGDDEDFQITLQDVLEKLNEQGYTDTIIIDLACAFADERGQRRFERDSDIVYNGGEKTPEKGGKRLNETLVEMLEKMSKLMNKKGDMMRSRIYGKAADSVLSVREDITDIEQVKGKPNIGPTMLSKMKEYIETGTLSVLEKEKSNPLLWLTDIHGIGPKKAGELIQKGIRNIEQLKERKEELLNNVQKMGLKYYDDVSKPIPRGDIDMFKKMFDEEFKKVAEEDSKYEIVGSYRRGKKASGDIDVIITSKNQEIFKKFVDSLKEKNIIVEILSYGNTKALVIGKLQPDSTARRIDFMYTPPDEYPFAILYFTGSKAFNTVMRGHALKMGISLNEHGMYEKQQGKEKGKKLDKKFTTEKEIFDDLQLKFKEPELRKDGSSVEPIKPVIEEKPKQDKQEGPKLGKLKRKYTKKKKITIHESELPELVPIVSQEPPKKKEEENKEEMVVSTRSSTKKEKNKTRKKRVLKEDNTQDIEKMPKMNVKKAELIMSQFKEQGIEVLEKMKEKDLQDFIQILNAQYYNTKKAMATDTEYDIIKELMERKYPKNTILEEVGAKIDKNKVKLPYEMASMDKIKPDTNALFNWKNKYGGPYVLSCKLDGVSGLYSTEGEEPKLYTRGNGIEGQDISYLIETLDLPKEKNIVVRGEFIIPKSVFEKKYKSKFANARNLVSGIINSKTLDKKAKDLHFVAYEVVNPQMRPAEQMEKLQEIGHEVVMNKTYEDITNELLSTLLVDWRTNYEYEIDGVIVSDNKIHVRKSGNPDYAFAFKMVISDQVAEVKVLDVIYSISKSGYIKPRVRIEPVKLGGVTIEYATGFNGKFIEDNKIGVGAIIEIIRSGDVIPYIKSVIQPAEQAKLPDMSYHWNETHVDMILDEIDDNEAVIEKNITAFFTSLKVDGLSEGNVKRIMKAGFKTIPTIILMKETDFEGIEGFKEKMIKKIYNGIQTKVKNASLVEIMAASNMLGRGLGLKKMKPIIEKYPDILTSSHSEEEKKDMLMSVDNIGKENANAFVSNIPKFMNFLKDAKLTDKLKSELKNTIEVKESSTKDTNHPLYDKHIVMTKVRDKYITEQLKKIGAHLDDNIGKNTNILITKSKEDVSNKTKKANEMKIPIMVPAEFVKTYNL
uniref:DNA-directed DNA polymerase n=1 Tax=viral metagenome TaxID=1070528 RepID=A0A6C0F7F8_9ZZZZ|tara:strand:+ start:51989 stop:56149 length:4161 start_codon:yes stop_codon:yes gene_type:complete